LRNWGDDQIVNHGDRAGWWGLLEICGSFRTKFLDATLQPLEKRRERKMRLEDYLLEGDFEDEA
jgi:hypothetical protein